MNVKCTIVSSLLLFTLQAIADTDIEGIGGTGAQPGEDGFGGTGRPVDSQRPELPQRPDLLDIPRVERPELERPDVADDLSGVDEDTASEGVAGEKPETPKD